MFIVSDRESAACRNVVAKPKNRDRLSVALNALAYVSVHKVLSLKVVEQSLNSAPRFTCKMGALPEKHIFGCKPRQTSASWSVFI